MARWCIVGCGYVGSALARRLIAETPPHEVVISRRDPVVAAAMARELGTGVRGIGLDLALASATSGASIGGLGSVVVCTAPPGIDPRGEIEELARVAAGARLVYISSTGVYAPGGGAWVDETWPTEPQTASGKARGLAEAALPAGAIVLRVAGIHGPGRGIADRIRAGTYRIVGDGTSHVSRIHVDDLVEAIVRAAASEITGPVNIADDDPAPIGEVADAIAARLGVDRPPRVAVTTVDPEIAGMLTADRRIANTRMKQALGVVLRYPSWRDG